MCIAIANVKNNPLSDEQIRNCWENNSDGAGILYKENGMLKTFKTMTSVEHFLKKYKKVITQSNCLIHFRITSAGSKTVANCHPFMVNQFLGMIHNGTISSSKYVKTGDESDTQSFTKQVLRGMPDGFLDYPVLQKMVGEAVGAGSKLAFMDIDEKFTIINSEAYGAHSDALGNWYSNKSYEQVNNYVWKGNKKVFKNAKTQCALPKKELCVRRPYTVISAFGAVIGSVLRPQGSRIWLTDDAAEKVKYQVQLVKPIKPVLTTDEKAKILVEKVSPPPVPEVKPKKSYVSSWSEFHDSFDNLDDDYWDEVEYSMEKSTTQLSDYMTDVSAVLDMVPTNLFHYSHNRVQRIGEYQIHDAKGAPITVREAIRILGEHYNQSMQYENAFDKYEEQWA